MNTEKTYYKKNEIDSSWSQYDQVVAKTHLNNYGVIFCDIEYEMPIDNEYELVGILREEMPELFEEENTKEFERE